MKPYTAPATRNAHADPLIAGIVNAFSAGVQAPSLIDSALAKVVEPKRVYLQPGHETFLPGGGWSHLIDVTDGVLLDVIEDEGFPRLALFRAYFKTGKGETVPCGCDLVICDYDVDCGSLYDITDSVPERVYRPLNTLAEQAWDKHIHSLAGCETKERVAQGVGRG